MGTRGVARGCTVVRWLQRAVSERSACAHEPGGPGAAGTGRSALMLPMTTLPNQYVPCSIYEALTLYRDKGGNVQ